MEVDEDDLERHDVLMAEPDAAIAAGAPAAAAFAPPPQAAAAPARGFLSRMFGAADEPTAAPVVPPPPRARKAKKKCGKVYRREADTNLISLKLGTLGEVVEVATGDPLYCSGCKAIFSSVSEQLREARSVSSRLSTVLETSSPFSGCDEMGDKAANDDEEEWHCEFCGQRNVLDLEPMERPRSNQLDYLVAPAPSTAPKSLDSSMVIFCIDTSGSMCVTSEIDGRIKLRGGGPSLGHLRQPGDGDQRLPGQRRNVTYVSRLQAVQAAVQTQIETLAREAPNKRVALLTFCSDVKIHGDGSTAATAVEGEKLEQVEQLLSAATGTAIGPVSGSGEKLIERLYELEEGGGTALAPSVYTALGMLPEGESAGCKMIVCTDGLANIGVGALDELETEEDTEAANAVYTDLGARAAALGVTIDVVAIDPGSGCDIENLGTMSEASGGTVTKLDPANLTSEFSAILAEPVVATSVQVKVLLHRGLRFRGEEDAADRPILIRDVGNATASTELSLEFSQRSASELSAAGVGGGPDEGPPPQLPFQTQIRFTRSDGSVVTRVISAAKPVSTSMDEIASAGVNTRLLCAHATKKSVQLAQSGDYLGSRVASRVYGQVMQSSCVSSEQMGSLQRWHAQNCDLDAALQAQQSTTAELDEMVENSSSSTERAMMSRSRSMHRKKARSQSDGFSGALFKANKSKSSDY